MNHCVFFPNNWTIFGQIVLPHVELTEKPIKKFCIHYKLCFVSEPIFVFLELPFNLVSKKPYKVKIKRFSLLPTLFGVRGHVPLSLMNEPEDVTLPN